MPSLANIVIADAQATPVNHTFVPVGPDKNGVQYLTDYSQANAVGYWQISIEVSSPTPARVGNNGQSSVHKVRVGLHEPVLETPGDSSASGIIPAPTVAYIPRSFVEYVIPMRSTTQNRKDLWKMTHLLAANPQLQNAVEDLVRFS
jgi:hypothetical protein